MIPLSAARVPYSSKQMQHFRSSFGIFDMKLRFTYGRLSIVVLVAIIGDLYIAESAYEDNLED